MKNNVKILIIAFICLLICGCSSANRNKIEKYLGEMEIFKNNKSSYVLDKERITIDNKIDTKYHTYAWKVNAKINNVDVEFYVLDIPQYEEFHFYDLTNTLNNNLMSIALGNINLGNFKLRKENASYLKNIYPNATPEIIDALDDNVLISYISDINELYDRYNELQDIYNTIYNLGWKNISLKYKLNLDNGLNYELFNDYISSYSFASLETLNKNIEKNRYNILENIIMFQFDKYLNNIDSEIISDMVNSYTYRIGIKNSSKESGYDLIDNLISYNGKISYGTLYKLLKKYGKNVIGTSDDFRFYKENGEIYSFSYTYYDNVKNENEKIKYYYLLNGNKVYFDRYNFNRPYLKFDEASRILGLELVELIYSEKTGIRINEFTN